MSNDLMTSTFGLVALPSYLEGIGSLVDLSGSFHNYNTSPTPQEADMRALHSDWEAIGKDFSDALDSLR